MFTASSLAELRQLKIIVKECGIVTTPPWSLSRKLINSACSGLDATECIFYDYSSLFALFELFAIRDYS